MSYDSNYTRLGFPRPTPAIGRLLAINFAVFVLNLLLGGRLSERTASGGGDWFCVSWTNLWDGYGLGLLRLVTYQFTHSFADPMHLLLNMLALWAFGRIVEERAGYRGTFKIYLVGGVAGAVLHMLTAALLLGGSVPVVGASGACYAIMLYAVAASPRAEMVFFVVRVQLIFVGVLLVGLALYSTVVEFLHGVSGGVSHGAHLGGAALGFAAYRFGWFRSYEAWSQQSSWLGSLRARWQRARVERAAQDAASLQEQVDRVLAKVHAEGLAALTPAERAVLERQAARNRKK